MTASLPSASIDIRTLENAAQAAYGTNPASLGLTAMDGANGKPLAISTTDGCTASAWLDQSGNVVIAYQGTSSTAQQVLDAAFLLGAPLSKLAGFGEAVSFAQTVQAQAARDGIAASKVFVTGHSLGGTLAEYVAMKTGLPGAAFAGSGLNGTATTGTASNFVSFVNQGDPFANFATDGSESAIAGLVSPHMDHYGEVALLGVQTQSKALMSFISTATVSGINSAAATTAFAAAWGNHPLGVYDSGIAAQFGSGTLAQIAAVEVPHPASGAAVQSMAASQTQQTLLAAVAGSAILHAELQPILSTLGALHIQV